MRIRPAQPADVPRLHALVGELAAHVGHEHQVASTAADFTTALFPAAGRPQVFALVAEADTPDGPLVVGHALWFLTFSTWTGRHGIWLEDLVVTAHHRGSGAGAALVAALAGICRDRGYARLEWNVDDANAAGQGFYRRLGSAPQDHLTIHRLDGQALARTAGTGHRPSTG